jgi:GT2 family glycosyltransferase
LHTMKIKLDSNITIGISAYGNLKATGVCIQSLLSSAEGDFELILVDDCSPDNGQISQLFLSVAEKHANTTVFRFDTNLEYSGSLNCILSHASGGKIIFLSNDIYVTPHYLSELISVADKDPTIGIVRGVSNFVDNGKPSHNIPTGKIDNYEDLCNFSGRVNQQHAGSFFYEDYLTGDAFLVNRRLMDKIGTFDPLFYGYFADPDFGIRAHIAGFKLAVAQGAFAYHDCHANFSYLDEVNKQKKINARWAKVHENWARFKMKYKMPVNLLYTNMKELNWPQLNKSGIDPYIEPGNYLAYKVFGPPPG